MAYTPAPQTPASKTPQLQDFSVTRTMTAGTDKAFTLPKGATLRMLILSGTASNAGTTATLSVGTTSGTPTEYVNGVSVLAAGVGNGVNVLNGVAGALPAKVTADTPIYVKYAETGAASNAGSWTLTAVWTMGSALAGVN